MRRISTLEQSVCRPSKRTHCEGDLRLARLELYLYSMSDGSETWVGPSADQQAFFTQFTNASLPRIYGKDWNDQSARVMAERGITEIITEVMVMTPRRFGKTYAIAMFNLAIMLAVPGTIINVYSPGSRASTSLMKLVKKFYASLVDEQGRLCGQNGERMFFSRTSVGGSTQSAAAKAAQDLPSTSQMACFPGGKVGQTHTKTNDNDDDDDDDNDDDDDGGGEQERSVSHSLTIHDQRRGR